MARPRRLDIRISEEEHASFTALAKKRGQSISDMIRGFVASALKRLK